MKFIILSLAMVFGLQMSFASEGSGARGGGDSIECNGGLFFFAGKWGKLADVAQSDNLYSPDPRDFDFLTLNEARAGVLKYLSVYRPDDAKRVITALSKLHFVFTSDDLPQLNTGLEVNGIGNFLLGCKKSQLAIQDYDGSVNDQVAVHVFLPNYNQLSILEKALLEIHEAYINIEHQNGSDYLSMENAARLQVKSIYDDSRVNGVLASIAEEGADFSLVLLPAEKPVIRKVEIYRADDRKSDEVRTNGWVQVTYTSEQSSFTKELPVSWEVDAPDTIYLNPHDPSKMAELSSVIVWDSAHLQSFELKETRTDSLGALNSRVEHCQVTFYSDGSKPSGGYVWYGGTVDDVGSDVVTDPRAQMRELYRLVALGEGNALDVQDYFSGDALKKYGGDAGLNAIKNDLATEPYINFNLKSGAYSKWDFHLGYADLYGHGFRDFCVDVVGSKHWISFEHSVLRKMMVQCRLNGWTSGSAEELDSCRIVSFDGCQ